MAKRFKLRLSLLSFQFCRSKKPHSFPKSPSTAATNYMFSPVNPKVLEIAYPNFPDPPPSPDHPKFKRQGKSKITPVNSKYPSKTSTNNITSKNMYNSRVPYDRVCSHFSSADSGWFSNEGEDETETESLISSSNSSYDFGYPLESTSKSPRGSKLKRNLKLGRLKHYVSKGGEKTKVNESFAVVKRSNDPYEDFKSSMMEMIMEKQIFEAKDLEQLLHCFLSLNFRQHHAVIVQAFSDIGRSCFYKE